MNKEEWFAFYNNSEAVKELVNGLESLIEGVKTGTHHVTQNADGWTTILPNN